MLILTSSRAIRQTVATLSDHVPVQVLNHYAARPQLWEINDDGSYQLMGKLDATTLAFWRSAHLQPGELDQAT